MSDFSSFLKSDESAARLLLCSPTYRQFLKNFIEIKKKRSKTYSFAELARKSEVSKSLPRDIVEGDKRITVKTLPKFLKAMELPGMLEDFFVQLIELEENPGKRNILDRLANLYLETYFINTFSEKNFKDFRVPFLYAASGDSEKGARIQTLATRTGFSFTDIREVLRIMESLNLGKVTADENGFVPSVSQIHVETEQGEVKFLEFYQFCLELQQEKIKNKSNLPGDLFYNDVFSVSEKDMEALKSELKKVLKSFVLKSENPAGDSVAVLNLGFFKQKFR